MKKFIFLIVGLLLLLGAGKALANSSVSCTEATYSNYVGAHTFKVTVDSLTVDEGTFTGGRVVPLPGTGTFTPVMTADGVVVQAPGPLVCSTPTTVPEQPQEAVPPPKGTPTPRKPPKVRDCRWIKGHYTPKIGRKLAKKWKLSCYPTRTVTPPKPKPKPKPPRRILPPVTG